MFNCFGHLIEINENYSVSGREESLPKQESSPVSAYISNKVSFKESRVEEQYGRAGIKL